MPSRKRVKGRARKAKAAEVPRNERPQQGLRSSNNAGAVGDCLHGASTVTFSPSHVLHKFRVAFTIKWMEIMKATVSREDGSVVAAVALALSNAVDLFPEVWKNDSLRKDTRTIFLFHAVDDILRRKLPHQLEHLDSRQQFFCLSTITLILTTQRI